MIILLSKALKMLKCFQTFDHWCACTGRYAEEYACSYSGLLSSICGCCGSDGSQSLVSVQKQIFCGSLGHFLCNDALAVVCVSQETGERRGGSRDTKAEPPHRTAKMLLIMFSVP